MNEEDWERVRTTRAPRATSFATAFGGSGEDEGIVDILRDTADSMGSLVAEHVKLAKLELVTDARRLAHRAALLLLAIPILVLGYGMLWLGGAMALGRIIGTAEALLLVGGLHVVAGAATLLVASRRRQASGAHVLAETATEVGRTLATIRSPAKSPANLSTTGAAI